MRVIACVSLTLLLTSCTGDPGATSMAERDSAGIRIVENEAGAAPYARFGSEPALVLGQGTEDPQTAFHLVVGAVRFTDGRIAVGDGSTAEIRFFAPDGSFLRRAGGLGRGPGEFASLDALLAAWQDSLIAHDRSRGTVHVFASSGEHVRALSLRESGLVDDVFLSGALRNGDLVFLRYGTVGTRVGPGVEPLTPGMIRDSAQVFRLAGDGSRLDTLASLPGGFWSAERVPQLGSIVLPVPVHFSALPLVQPWDDLVALGSGDSYELRLVAAATGRVQRIVRKRYDQEPVTGADVSDLMRRYREQAGESRNPAVLLTLDVLENAPAVQHRPPYAGAPCRAAVDADGNLWVPAYVALLTAFGESPDNGLVPRWDVFAPDGRFLGVVASPPHFRLAQLGTDLAVGVAVDDGVERVVVYDLAIATSEAN